MAIVNKNQNKNTIHFQILPFSGPTRAKMVLFGVCMPPKYVVKGIQSEDLFQNDDKKSRVKNLHLLST